MVIKCSPLSVKIKVSIKTSLNHKSHKRLFGHMMLSAAETNWFNLLYVITRTHYNYTNKYKNKFTNKFTNKSQLHERYQNIDCFLVTKLVTKQRLH